MRYQSMQRDIGLLVCVVALLSSCAQEAFATDDVLAQVAGIFAAVEGPSENKSSTQSAYIQLQKLKPGETASDSACDAYLLGLVQLHKQREAIAYAGELIQRNVHEANNR